MPSSEVEKEIYAIKIIYIESIVGWIMIIIVIAVLPLLFYYWHLRIAYLEYAYKAQ